MPLHRAGGGDTPAAVSRLWDVLIDVGLLRSLQVIGAGSAPLACDISRGCQGGGTDLQLTCRTNSGTQVM